MVAGGVEGGRGTAATAVGLRRAWMMGALAPVRRDWRRMVFSDGRLGGSDGDEGEGEGEDGARSDRGD